jgi:hypothetical protein
MTILPLVAISLSYVQPYIQQRFADYYATSRRLFQHYKAIYTVTVRDHTASCRRLFELFTELYTPSVCRLFCH